MRTTRFFLFFTGLFLSILAGLTLAEAGTKAVAELKGTAPDSAISGKVFLTETSEGLLVEAQVANVPDPGPHGFHIHEKGSCDDAGKAAGGHYNPAQAPHGLLPHDGHDKAHAGDMGNIEINAEGKGQLTIVLPHVHLSGEMNNVSGLAVILHEKTDDFSQPTGNAGGRIGCGIIEKVSE